MIDYAYRCFVVLSHNMGVGDDRDEPVDVGPQVQLDHVPVGQHHVRLGHERAEVADHIVDRDAGGERNT